MESLGVCLPLYLPIFACDAACIESGDGAGERAGGHPRRQGCKQSTQGAALPPARAFPYMLAATPPQGVLNPVERLRW